MTRSYGRGRSTGVTVLDLCSYLAGPYGCTLLADLGADVIKIESPQGDMLRQFPSSLAGREPLFPRHQSRQARARARPEAARGAGRTAPDGRDAPMCWSRISARRCRPGSASTTRACKKINPRLVYAGVTGYGDSGPLSEKGGFDQVLQCLTGMAVFQGGGPRSRSSCSARCSTISPRRCSPMASRRRCSTASAAARGSI